MDRLHIFLIIISIISFISAFIIIVAYRLTMKRTMNKLYNMIDSAIDGSFNETSFDESKLSAIESKLNSYLNQNLISSQEVTKEKDKIKELISDISHQTKTPIANIMLYSALLEEQEKLSEDTRSMIKKISEQSKKLNFLIGALIKTSRLESGIISVKPDTNSVKALIEESLKQTLMEAGEKNIKVALELQEDEAVFDMKWTSEALINIIQNALKYTEENGRITIVNRSYEMFSRIDISDTGMGIEESEYSRIFSRFYRSPRVQQVEGVGIGLFLTREILSSQGAYIKVTSRVGEGSTFSIFLPKN